MSLWHHCRWWGWPNTVTFQVSEPFHAVPCTKSQCDRERHVERLSQRGLMVAILQPAILSYWRNLFSTVSHEWGKKQSQNSSPITEDATWTCYERANSPWAGSLQGLELARFNQYCLDKLCTNFFPRLCPFFETSFWWFLLWINGKCCVILPSLLSSLEVRALNGKSFQN